MVDYRIEHGLVLTCENGLINGAVYADGAVAVTGDTITMVGKTEDVRRAYPDARRVIDASGRIVMPGFIVTHTHMPYVLGHNQPVDFSQLRSFWDMLQKMGWEWLEDITTRDGIYAATRYAAAKMLRKRHDHGLRARGGAERLPGPLSASAKAVSEIGIRAQIGYEVTERVPGVSFLERLDRAKAERGFEENIAFLEKYPADGKGVIREGWACIRPIPIPGRP
jgi:cytosine/adenosine deaminase-related metal-dependent hydrolase